MADWHTLPRLFVRHTLKENIGFSAEPEQAHYLTRVLRMTTHDRLRVFNGIDGEWLAEVAEIHKKSCNINILSNIKPQTSKNNLWLCSAPIKKAHYDYSIEKATELGVSEVRPLLTSRTQVREVNTERLQLIATESAEQSGRLDVPTVKSAISLNEFIETLPEDAFVIVCAEWGDATPVAEAFGKVKNPSNQATMIVTGPEGGFTKEELENLRKVKNSCFVRLGPRILRADTAAIAALSCWQALCGDWRENTH